MLQAVLCSGQRLRVRRIWHLEPSEQDPARTRTSCRRYAGPCSALSAVRLPWSFRRAPV